MTIACVFIAPEGVVFGADSTSSVNHGNGDGYHFFNFAQKLFEVGENSRLAMLTWGMGGLGGVSFRGLIARLAREIRLAPQPPTGVGEVMQAWINLFWPAFVASPEYAKWLSLDDRPANGSGAPNERSADEEKAHRQLTSSIGVGFCLGGYASDDATQGEAFSVGFTATRTPPTATALTAGAIQCWGMPNILNRLIFGIDDNILDAIVSSGLWTGTPDDLIKVVTAHSMLPRVNLPIRDAIDYVYSVIYSTIKGMKFSALPQVCGGPIELAVVTADRRFRWVRHKAWDAAITDGDLS